MRAQYQSDYDFVKKLDYQLVLSNPILDIAAQSWEKERYEASKVCYKFMRVVDDLVDDAKASGKSPELGGLKAVNRALQSQLLQIRERFHIPLWPWQKFSESMAYDMKHEGFKDFPTFIRYCKGAAVAPAAIFLHFCGVNKKKEGYEVPEFDIKKTAEPAALFCYLVHIVRDFQKDQNKNLNYFADSIMKENDIDKQTLKDIASGGEITPGFRGLMAEYYDLAEYYKRKTRRSMEKIYPYLEAPYQLSIELIYGLYSQIFERIDVKNGLFTAAELNPTPEEVKKRVELIVSDFSVC
jgi:phytoene/squalene synthetase